VAAPVSAIGRPSKAEPRAHVGEEEKGTAHPKRHFGVGLLGHVTGHGGDPILRGEETRRTVPQHATSSVKDQ